MSQEAAPIRLLTAALPSWRTRTAAPQVTGLPTSAAGPAGGQAGWSAAFPLIVLLTSVGTLAVAAAYAAGREGWPYLSALYWPGQLLVYVPIAVRAYSPRLTGPAEGFALLLLLFVQQTLLFRMYSPLELKFPDELQHWRGTVNVVQSGALDQANYSLPVAVHYPGLEALGGAVSASTGLSVTATAFIVAALLHLLLACALYVLCLRIRADWRVATVACIVYAASPQYMVFDAMYIYQSLALPFLLLAVWALRVLRLPGRAAGRWAVLLISIGVVTVSHHLTSFVMVALLGSLTAAGLCRPRPGRELRPAAAWLVATAAVLAWVLLVARDVVGYVDPVLAQLGHNAIGLLHGRLGATAPGAAPLAEPVDERLATIGALGILALLVVRGSRGLWPERRAEPWTLPLIGGAWLIFVAGALRAVASDGGELAGRASTFIYIPVALVAAITLCDIRRRGPGRRRRQGDRDTGLRAPALLGGAAPVMVAAVILMGGVASGWPPVWDRLPGPYLVSGFERSVDPQGVAAAVWALGALGPGHRWAEDFTDNSLLATIGDQNTVRAVGLLFDGKGADATARALVQYQQIEFFAVDLRDSMQLPAGGAYFPVDPNAERYRSPLPRTDLEAPGRVAGVSRIYDSGDISLYDLRGSAYDG
ncbi:MAG: hypothetical protein ABSF03_14885 [Streptosporangiaceae bacterium]